MNEELQKQVKAGRILPIFYAILGIAYCAFIFFYQTENPQDKQDLLTFFLGALVTLGGILTLYQSYATQSLILKSKEVSEEEEEEEGI